MDLASRLDAILPQTQCTKCGYPGCRPYAEAIATGAAGINRCPPGGETVIRQLAALTGRPYLPLDAALGPTMPRRIAMVEEPHCIGCTLCIRACPVDAIAGAPKRMHTVIAELCTGCELCVPPCPVDCITLLPARAEDEWTSTRADQARQRFLKRQARLAKEKGPPAPRRDAAAHPDEALRRARIIEKAMQRARAARRNHRSGEAS